MADVYLKYLGNKPQFPDVLAGTRTIWYGQGDIQPVPEAAAQRILASFRDPVFEIVPIKEALKAAQAAPLEDKAKPVKAKSTTPTKGKASKASKAAVSNDPPDTEAFDDGLGLGDAQAKAGAE